MRETDRARETERGERQIARERETEREEERSHPPQRRGSAPVCDGRELPALTVHLVHAIQCTIWKKKPHADQRPH